MRSQQEAGRPLSPLPIPQTSFIGCESAVAEIRQLLRTTRLLTLTGSGGSGKTRLALRVAEEALAVYPDGVYWVDLAALADPTLMPQTVAAALGLSEQSGQSITDLLIEHLREHGPLLILDNCEHLRAACAELLTTLFSAGVLARVLATSRIPLAVEGERVYPAPMLAVPGRQPASPAELAQVEAVRLWVERARMVSPSFTLHDQNAEIVAEICRQLDGMPLAIELAAARVNVLTPKQILDRLGDSVRLLTRGAQPAAARHRTLRAALDWSFDLLSPAEQAFFIRLAVFAGSFGLEAVESICAGEGIERDALLDLLADLVEKSLVVAAEAGEEMRYRLLAPIRHYAAARLRATDQEAHWRERHAAWCLTLACRADLELSGPDQKIWLERLEREHDNLRAALAWYTAAPDKTEAGLRLGSALTRYWCIRGNLSEGRRWLETLLGRLERQLETGVTPQTEVDAFNALGRIAFQQSNFLAARAHHERSLALARRIEYDDGVETALIGLGAAFWELGDYQAARSYLEETVRYARPAQHLHALGQALNMLGLVCMHQGDRQAAQACLDESLSINRRLGHRIGIATVLWNLALLAEQGGDHTHSSLLYQEALRIHRELGNRWNTADILGNLGANAVAAGDFAAAAAYFEEAGRLYHELGATGDMAYISAGLGDIAFYNGDYAAARAHYQEALALFREAGNQRLIGRALGRLGRIACREGDLTTAASLSAEALRVRLAIGHKAGIIFALDEEYVELALAAGRPTVAARLLGAVETARRSLQRPRPPVEARAMEPIMAGLRERLGPAWPAAWAEGEAMGLEQAAAYALDILSPAVVAEPHPEVRILAFGPVRIYRGDRLLTSADWTYTKARELVLYLLCHPNASRDQVGLAFWPDASAAQVRKRFSAALAHARNALGRDAEWITLHDGRYRIDPARSYWFDVAVFEDRLRSAHHLLQNGGPSEPAISLLEKAIELYQGDFAEDLLEGEWHYPFRASLLQSYLEALLTLGKLHARAGRYEQAIAAYRRALDKDPYLEEAHHELIGCYIRLNRRSQALRQYDTLTAALAELNATPSPELQQLIERLRHGEPL